MDLPLYDLLGQIIPYIPILFLTYFLITRTQTWFHLRKFQGPYLGKFTYAFMAKTAASGRMNHIYWDVSRKYGNYLQPDVVIDVTLELRLVQLRRITGSLARIGPNDLITDDPDIVRMMSGARSAYNRSTWYQGLRIDPYLDNIGSEMDVQIHDARRAKMASAFGGKENPTLETDIDHCIAQMIHLIRTKYISTNQVRPMDFATKASYLTLDLISKVAFGEEFGFLREDKDVYDYISISKAVMPYISFFTMIPQANALLNRGWLRQTFGPGPDDKYGLGKIMGVARKVAGERFGENKITRQDMLGAFVRNGISQRQIEAEGVIQIIAGSDTTATAIRATVLYLLTHPRVLAKLRAELDHAEKNGKISDPISNAESKALPYLQAVVKEGVRIYPPFTGLAMKQVPPAGDTIKGRYVPGGVRIAHNAWGLLRNDIFGNDVEVFRPERWIEVDEKEHLVRMEQCLELVFGYGRWGCLSKNIAWLELNKVFVQLLRNFDFELLRPEMPWKSQNFSLFLQSDMWVRVSERTRT